MLMLGCDVTHRPGVDSLFHVHSLDNNNFTGAATSTALAECVSQATWLKKLRWVHCTVTYNLWWVKCLVVYLMCWEHMWYVIVILILSILYSVQVFLHGYNHVFVINYGITVCVQKPVIMIIPINDQMLMLRCDMWHINLVLTVCFMFTASTTTTSLARRHRLLWRSASVKPRGWRN